jgi:hypothetical protein
MIFSKFLIIKINGALPADSAQAVKISEYVGLSLMAILLLLSSPVHKKSCSLSDAERAV